MKAYLDKIGGFGAILAGAACPVCFPQLAALGAIFGLGAFGSYEGQIFLATQILVVLAVIGHVLAYLQHRMAWVLSMAVAGGASFFLGLYVFSSETVIYAGFAALMLASMIDIVRRKQLRRKLGAQAGAK